MHVAVRVLMHLVVLGAFCRGWGCPPTWDGCGLNAPSGAGRFLPEVVLTGDPDSLGVLMHLVVLGAFWHRSYQLEETFRSVLMHLVVLGAF